MSFAGVRWAVPRAVEGGAKGDDRGSSERTRGVEGRVDSAGESWF